MNWQKIIQHYDRVGKLLPQFTCLNEQRYFSYLKPFSDDDTLIDYMEQVRKGVIEKELYASQRGEGLRWDKEEQKEKIDKAVKQWKSDEYKASYFVRGWLKRTKPSKEEIVFKNIQELVNKYMIATDPQKQLLIKRMFAQWKRTILANKYITESLVTRNEEERQELEQLIREDLENESRS